MAAKQSIFLNRKKEKAVLPTLSETLPGMYMSDEPLNVSDAHISCPGHFVLLFLVDMGIHSKPCMILHDWRYCKLYQR